MPRTKKSDTSNISELATQFQDDARHLLLESQNVKLAEQITLLKLQLQDREEEIAHIKSLLASAPSALILSPSEEEEIALKQFKYLKAQSEQRQLTLEEIKMFDLLVKNKRLATPQALPERDVTNLPKSKSKLIQIAARVVKEDDGESH